MTGQRSDSIGRTVVQTVAKNVDIVQFKFIIGRINFIILRVIDLSESSGRIKGVIPNNCHLSLVPEFLCNVVPEQEGSVRRKDSILASG